MPPKSVRTAIADFDAPGIDSVESLVAAVSEMSGHSVMPRVLAPPWVGGASPSPR